MKKFLLLTFITCLLTPMFSYAYVAPERIERALGIFFKNDPVMISIAECESEFRHYTPDGSVLRGGLSDKMVGLYQIHEDYHRDRALRMGVDIDTLVGNILYAKVLYTFQGVTPWVSCV